MAVHSLTKKLSLFPRRAEFTAVKEVCLSLQAATGYLSVHVTGLVDSLEGDNS